MKKLNLDALITMRPQIEAGGQTYDVRPITARIATMLDAAAEAEGGAKMYGYYDAAAALVPTMSREQLDDLAPQQILAIIDFASQQMRVVEEAAADPNSTSSAPMAAASSEAPAAI